MTWNAMRRNDLCSMVLGMLALLGAMATDARAVTIDWTTVGNPGKSRYDGDDDRPDHWLRRGLLYLSNRQI